MQLLFSYDCTNIVSKCIQHKKKQDEECDDGNTLDGDGCDYQCHLEPGYSYPPLHCTDKCGDGVVICRAKGLLHYCDDGNNLSGDGCNGACGVEKGWVCYGGGPTRPDQCYELCGDGITFNKTHDPDYCDDGNTNNGDGCSMECKIESGYTCTGGGVDQRDICTKECIPQNCALCTENEKICHICKGGYFVQDDGTCLSNYYFLEYTGIYQQLAHASIALSIVAILTAIAIGIFTKSAPVAVWIVVNQFQLFCVLLLTNSELPKDVVLFIKHHQVYLFGMEFLRFSLPSHFGAGGFGKLQPHRELRNVGLEYQSVVPNSLGIVFALVLICLLHVMLYICKSKTPTNTALSRILSRYLEGILRYCTFGVYIRLLLQASMFMALVATSEILKFDTPTLSLELSLVISFIMVFLIAVVYAFSWYICLKSSGNADSGDYYKSVFNELYSGLKSSTKSRVYTPILLTRRLFVVLWTVSLLGSHTFIIVKGLIFAQVIYTLTFLILRPYKTAVNNIIEAVNEVTFGVLAFAILRINSKEEWSTPVKFMFVATMLINILATVLILLGYLLLSLKNLYCSRARSDSIIPPSQLTPKLKLPNHKFSKIPHPEAHSERLPKQFGPISGIFEEEKQ
ncbi:unnamed protein product [Moneuplotes crassus]|uniref:Uncharacterized protein n=1 Tax=Euplotes crassus TaxID=5936 RepID=A0AAD1Y9H9_EUPCR|nr:unnamed protein product [Moneuplotes crassus]